MAIYQFLKDYMSGSDDPVGVRLKSENKGIPLDPNNADYQEYLKWVAEGNTADAAASDPKDD